MCATTSRPAVLVLVVCFAGGCLASGLPMRARAQSEVRIRCASQLDVTAARAGDRLEVTGRLVDDMIRGIADAVVRIDAREADSTGDASASAVTDATGSFTANLAPYGGRSADVRASYEGDAWHDPIEQSVPVEARAQVQITWLGAEREPIDLDTPQHRLAVHAASEAGGAGLAIEVRDELGRLLARGQTDAAGDFVATIHARAVGTPGIGRLSARTAADRARAEGRADRTVVRFRSSHLTVAARRLRDALVIDGSLAHAGGPLGHRAVGLFLGDDHAASVWTEADGRFAFRRAPSAEGEDGTWEVRFDSDAPWIGSSRSGPLRVTREPGVPPRAMLAVSIALAGVLLVLARARPAPAQAVSPERPGVTVAGGTGWTRRSHRHVSGSVSDALRDAPVPSARVELRRIGNDAPPVSLALTNEGAFSSPPLAGGEWSLQVDAPGYGRVQAVVAVPHAGQWLRTRVRIETLRAGAMRSYRAVANEVLPDPSLWAYWSERDVLAVAGEELGSDDAALVRLTEQVERACYGPHAPTEQAVDEIGQRAREVRTQLRLRGGRRAGTSAPTSVRR